eukprot:2780899-Rhodomonas_salina.2
MGADSEFYIRIEIQYKMLAVKRQAEAKRQSIGIMLFAVVPGQKLAYGFVSGVYGCTKTGINDEVRPPALLKRLCDQHRHQHSCEYLPRKCRCH